MLKLLSLFSGIGAFEKALENIGEPFEIIRYCEIDKYASKAYSLIHNLDENMNLKDVCSIKTETLPDDIDFITYGFPCQDISQSGKQKGFTDENGNLTRSGLFFEALRIIEDTQPKIAIAENVKALTGKRFTAEFKIVLDSLNDAGYRNYWAVLNAKDYGIPQNRERVFIISIRDDIDHGFQFPKKYELKLRLKDLLEDAVDEKYYLSDKAILGLIAHAEKQKQKGNTFCAVIKTKDDIASTIKARYYKDGSDCLILDGISIEETTKKKDVEVNNTRPQRLFNIYGEKTGTGHGGNVWDKNCISPTLLASIGGNKQPLIIDDYLPIKNATKKGYAEAHDGDYVNLQFPNSKTRRGRVGEQCANTLMCNDANGVVVKKIEQMSLFDDSPSIQKIDEKIIIDDTQGFDGIRIYKDYAPSLRSSRSGLKTYYNLRIRKLTPKECFRLMGFDDKDCDVLSENKISNTQLYKMAGNSIVVVDVLEEIFVSLLNQYDDVFPMVIE